MNLHPYKDSSAPPAPRVRWHFALRGEVDRWEPDSHDAARAFLAVWACVLIVWVCLFVSNGFDLYTRRCTAVVVGGLALWFAVFVRVERRVEP